MDEDGRELDSEPLGKSKTPIARIRVGPVWNLRSSARLRRVYLRNNEIWNSKVPRQESDTEAPGRGSKPAKALEWAKCPQEQVILEKILADGGKGHMQPYCMVGVCDNKTPKGKKYQWLL